MSPISSTLAGASARGYGGLGASVVAATNESFEPIATYLLASSGTDITFNSIPQTYKHLQVRAIVKGSRTNGNDGWSVRINDDSSGGNTWTHYFRTITPINKNSGGYSGTRMELGEIPGVYSNVNDTFSVFVVDFIDYTNTNKYKTAISVGGHDQNGTTASNGDTDMLNYYSNSWQNTNAINKLVFNGNTVSLAANSRITLYGIKG